LCPGGDIALTPPGQLFSRVDRGRYGLLVLEDRLAKVSGQRRPKAWDFAIGSR